MKICASCSKQKPKTEFAWSNKARGQRQIYCHECRRSKAKVAYTHAKKKNILRSIKNNKLKTVMFQTIKSSLCCVVCGENAPIALDFHHKDPNKKDFQLGGGYLTKAWNTILFEMSKCVCLCATHHRKIHGGLIDCTPLPTVDIETIKTKFFNYAS